MTIIDLYSDINIFILLLLLISGVFVTFLLYSGTFPKTKRITRSLLIVLRVSQIILILFLVVNLTLTSKSIKTIEKKNIFLFDNTSSVKIVSSENQKKMLTQFFNEVSTIKNNEVYIFDQNVHRKNEQNNKLILNGKTTNFENIFRFIRERHDTLSNYIIVSDGNVNSGMSYSPNDNVFFNKIFTVGIGDTSETEDLFIDDVVLNYPLRINEKNNAIVIAGLTQSDRKVNSQVSVYINNNFNGKKPITIYPGEPVSLPFDFILKDSGNVDFLFKLIPAPGEKNILNNSFTKTLFIQNNRNKILMLNGLPNADYAALKKTLSENDKNQIVEINIDESPEKITNNYFRGFNIIIISGWPGSKTDNTIISRIKTSINSLNKPLIYFISNDVDYEKLGLISPSFGFRVITVKDNFYNGSIENKSNSSLFISEELKGPLPEIFISGTDILFDNEFVVDKEVTRSDGSARPFILYKNNPLKSIIINGSGLFKWRLINKPSYNNFIENCLSYLKSSSLDIIQINPVKKVFNLNEKTVFTGQILNETKIPLINNPTLLKISRQGMPAIEEYSFSFTNTGYYLEFNNKSSGNFNYEITTNINNKIYKKTGIFIVNNEDIESLSNTQNDGLLKKISEDTDANYYPVEKYKQLIDFINSSGTISGEEEFVSKPIIPFEYPVLICILLLILFELVIRKKNGLL